MKYFCFIIGLISSITGVYALGEHYYTGENFHSILIYTIIAIIYTIVNGYLIEQDWKKK